MQRARFAATLGKGRFLPHKEVRETIASEIAVGDRPETTSAARPASWWLSSNTAAGCRCLSRVRCLPLEMLSESETPQVQRLMTIVILPDSKPRARPSAHIQVLNRAGQKTGGVWKR